MQVEINRNHAELNWQYPMGHMYETEAKKCRRMHWTPSSTIYLSKNQAEVNWHYPMDNKYQVEANKCLKASASERAKHSKTTTPSRTRKDRSVRR